MLHTNAVLSSRIFTCWGGLPLVTFTLRLKSVLTRTPYRIYSDSVMELGSGCEKKPLPIQKTVALPLALQIFTLMVLV